MDGSEIERSLECCEFFKGLNKRDIEKIAGLGKIAAYNAGEYIFQQHDFGEHLYIIAEGRVSLERTVDMGTRKGSVTIETLGKGRVLGCWSTLLGEPHFLMSSAVCQLPTKVAVLKGAVLREMMLENREIGFNIMERFCFLLRERIQAVYWALEKF